MSDGDLERLPQADGIPYPLGRHLWHDPRNREYPIREKLPRTTTPRTRPWWRRGIYNQGNIGRCTAEAAAGVASTSPFRMQAPSRQALPSYDEPHERHGLYLAAQHVDPFDFTPPGEGSSTDAPFKVLRDRGHIKAWRWCFGMDDIDDTLNVWGPIAVGVRWHESDFDVDSRGYIEGKGAVVGGHAFEIVYYDADDDRYRGIQSWGTPWGDGGIGRFWIARDDLGDRIEDRGEAVTVVL